MKLTLIREDKKNQMHVTLKSMESLMERITKDTKTEDVQALRRYLASPEDKELVERYTGLLHRIYPSAELVKAGKRICIVENIQRRPNQEIRCH